MSMLSHFDPFFFFLWAFSGSVILLYLCVQALILPCMDGSHVNVMVLCLSHWSLIFHNVIVQNRFPYIHSYPCWSSGSDQWLTNLTLADKFPFWCRFAFRNNTICRHPILHCQFNLTLKKKEKKGRNTISEKERYYTKMNYKFGINWSVKEN